jgi:error-prone DNA polymerase
MTGCEVPELPSPTAFDHVADDLWALGVTPDHTAIELVRKELKERGVVSAADLTIASDDHRVSVAGVVTHRQQPETARGAVFLNLEDETGMVNVIFSKGAWVRWQDVALSSRVLIVRGTVERQYGAIAVVAERVEALQIGPVPASRDFR